MDISVSGSAARHGQSHGDARDAPQELTRALALLWERMRDQGFLETRLTDVRALVRVVINAALASGMTAERLLCVVKDGWRTQPEVVRAPQRYIADECRDRLVSQFIDEYYDVLRVRDSAPTVTDART